jgi:hypothetical protein
MPTCNVPTLEEEDDGFGKQYASMFSRAANGLHNGLPTRGQLSPA